MDIETKEGVLGRWAHLNRDKLEVNAKEPILKFGGLQEIEPGRLLHSV